MAYGSNRQPRWLTIIVALGLTAVGVLGTFVKLLPRGVGVLAYVVATIVMLLGVFLPGL